ncbi:MAG: V-type ATP synthase subunit D [Bacteroidia bacterium]
MRLIQYTKVALQQYQKALKIRQAALPVIRSKESALRNEVKQQQKQLQALEAAYLTQLEAAALLGELWQHWPGGMPELKAIHTQMQNFAGVKLQRFRELELAESGLDPLQHPAWYFDAWLSLRALLELRAQLQLKAQEVAALEAERKRTTQKLNLFEKVQIPHYEEAIRKIKRYLEDEENLGKATQKIMKKKKEAAA